MWNHHSNRGNIVVTASNCFIYECSKIGSSEVQSRLEAGTLETVVFRYAYIINCRIRCDINGYII